MLFEKLFSPIKIKNLELRNRVVLSAMGTHESAESADGREVTDKLIAYHAARAKGGCGLNTVEVTSVDAASAPHGFLSIAEDKYIPGLQKLNDAVHAAGGKTCVQLWQGGLAVASDQTAQILLPNDMPMSAEYTVPGITEERLYSVIEAFGAAAKRAVTAGFDCLEFHCAHNYLPHSMLSGGLNHRTDCWGGSFENRKKFPLACIRAIRENMPEGMPLLMRIGCHDDMLEGGLTIEEVIEFCKDAKEAGVDVLNISRGNIVTAATVYEVAPVDIPKGFNVEDAARIRQETGMLTMPCGRINTPELAEQILEEDFYASLSDPEVKHITCMRNPALLEEEAWALTPGVKSRKVMIVGGGIAGIEAALNLKKTGNEPVIFEKSSRLGGQFTLAGAAPGKSDFQYAADKAVANVKDQGIEVHLNTEVTPELIEKMHPDIVILAAGSTPIVPDIPGRDSEIVTESHDLLEGKEFSGKTAVVIGGGLVGFECAEYLASRGVKADILEMKPEVLADLGQLRKITSQFSLSELPVTVHTNTVCKAIEADKVIAQKDQEQVSFQAELVVMAVGTKSADTTALQEICQKLEIPAYLIGDAKKAPGMALNAIHDAYHAVLDINQ
ncbi:MAG: FAD-dependent oxidoreductase [Lachnospiraceae bacterium]|nr:FAD-dependent oxidoreductase [Lachnospiraceae bacterium]